MQPSRLHPLRRTVRCGWKLWKKLKKQTNKTLKFYLVSIEIRNLEVAALINSELQIYKLLMQQLQYINLINLPIRT